MARKNVDINAKFNTSEFSKGIKRAKNDLNGLSRAGKSAGENLKTHTRRVKREISEASGVVGKFSTAIQVGVGTVAGIAFTRLLARVADFTTAMVSAPIRIGSAFEQIETDFKVFLGDIESARAFVKDINDLAAKTPFESRTLMQGAQTLLSYGVNSEKILPTLRQLGEITGANAQRFESMILGFAQASATGKLLGQDLRQMVNAGLSVKDLAGAMGYTTSKFLEMKEKGKISIEQVRAALDKLTSEGGKYFGRLEEGSKTTIGLWTTLTSNVELLANAIGKVFLPSVRALLRDWIKVAQSMTKSVTVFLEIEDATGKFSSALKDLIAVIGITIGVLGISGLIKAFLVYRNTLIQVTAAQVAWAAFVKGEFAISILYAKDAILAFTRALLANPYLLVGAGIITLSTAFLALRKNVKTVTSELESNLEKLIINRSNFEKLVTTVDPLIKKYEELRGKTNKTAEEEREYAKIRDVLIRTFPELSDAIGSELSIKDKLITQLKEARKQELKLKLAILERKQAQDLAKYGEEAYGETPYMALPLFYDPSRDKKDQEVVDKIYERAAEIKSLYAELAAVEYKGEEKPKDVEIEKFNEFKKRLKKELKLKEQAKEYDLNKTYLTEKEKLAISLEYENEKNTKIRNMMKNLGVNAQYIDAITNVYDIDFSKFDEVTKEKLELLQDYLNQSEIQLLKYYAKEDKLRGRSFQSFRQTLTDMIEQAKITSDVIRDLAKITADAVSSLSDSISGSLSQSIQDFLNKSKSLSEAIKDFFGEVKKSIIKMVADMIAEMFKLYVLQPLLEGMFSTFLNNTKSYSKAITSIGNSFVKIATSAPAASIGVTTLSAAQKKATPEMQKSKQPMEEAGKSYSKLATESRKAAVSVAQLAVSQAAYSVALIPLIGGFLAPAAAVSTGAGIAAGAATATAGLALGNLIGGFFAEGGRPPLGIPSVVGEKGPELFVPDRSGTIIPNNKLTSRGMSGSDQHNYVYAPQIKTGASAEEVFNVLEKHSKKFFAKVQEGVETNSGLRNAVRAQQ